MTREEFLAQSQGSAPTTRSAFLANAVDKTQITKSEFLASAAEKKDLEATNARIQNESFGLNKATSIRPAPTAREATASIPGVLTALEGGRDNPYAIQNMARGVKEYFAPKEKTEYEKQHPIRSKVDKVANTLASLILGDSYTPLGLGANAAMWMTGEKVAELPAMLSKAGKPAAQAALRAPEAYLPRGIADSRNYLEKVGGKITELPEKAIPVSPGLGTARAEVSKVEGSLQKQAQKVAGTLPVAKEVPAIKSELAPEARARDLIVKAKLAETIPIDESTIKLGAERVSAITPPHPDDIKIGEKLYNLGKAQTVKFEKPENVIKTIAAPEVSDRKLWWQKAFSFITPSTDMMKHLGPHGEELTKRYMEGVTVSTLRSAKMDQVLSSLFTKLSPEETANVVTIMDKGGLPINPRVKRITDILNVMMEKASDEANASGIRVLVDGGKKIPIPVKRHFPHYHDFEANQESILDEIIKTTKVSRPQAEEIAIKNLATKRKVSIDEARKLFVDTPGSRENVIGKIMAEQQISRGEAKKMLDTYAQQSAMIKRAGHLERPRTSSMPGYIQDPLTVYRRYFHDLFHRVEIAKQLGVENQVSNKLINAMPFNQQPLARGLLEAMTENVAGGDISHMVKGMGDKVTDFLTRKYMGLSMLNNLDQGFYGSAVRTSFGNALSSVRKAFTKEGRALARETGTILDDFSTGFSKFAKTKNLLEKSGFQKSEQFNRTVATIAQRDCLPNYLSALKKNPNNPQVMRELGYLGFGKKEIEKVLARGQFTADEASKAALRMNWQTQFRFSPAEMPMLYSMPGGKMFYHLSSFTLNWTSKVLNGYVLAEARKGNVNPLLKLLAYGEIGGETKAAIWGLVSDKERRYKWDEAPVKRILDNLAWATSLGILSDVLLPAGTKTKMEGAFAPPVAGYGAEAEKGLTGLLKGDLAPAARFGLRRVAVPAAVMTGGFPLAVGTRAVGERLINAMGGADVTPKPKKKPSNETSSLRNIFNTSVPESLKYAPLALGVLAGAKGKGLGYLAKGVSAKALEGLSEKELVAMAEKMPKGAFTALWDKKVRVAISDSSMKLLENKTPDISKPLSKVVSDWEIFKIYPEIKNIAIRKDLSIGKGGGHLEEGMKVHGQKRFTIVYNETNEENLKGTIVHEIEHYIQQKEKFAQGTAPDVERDIIKKMGLKGETGQQRYDNTAGEIDSFAQELMRKHPKWSINKAMHESNIAGEGKPIKDWIIKGGGNRSAKISKPFVEYDHVLVNSWTEPGRPSSKVKTEIVITNKKDRLEELFNETGAIKAIYVPETKTFYAWNGYHGDHMPIINQLAKKYKELDGEGVKFFDVDKTDLGFTSFADRFKKDIGI